MVTKGAVVYVTISAAFVALAGTMNIKIGGKTPESVEKDYTDNTSPYVPHAATGRVKMGDVTCDLWYDDDNAGHIFLDAMASAPLTYEGTAMKIVLSTTELITWSSAVLEVGSYDLVDGGLVKMSIKSTPVLGVTMPT